MGIFTRQTLQTASDVGEVSEIRFLDNREVSGVIPIEDAYPRLLSLDSRIRVIGYLPGKVSLQYEILGIPYERNNSQVRGWNLSFISHPQTSGEIICLDKEYDKADEPGAELSKKEILVHACWLSGDNAGLRFMVSRHPSWVRDKEGVPSHIYLPPRIIIWSLQFLVVSGAAFVALKEWKALLAKIWEWAVAG
ncbi:MAG TPA: hypothetical protein VE954_38905 [Oligoflexus sp.]|uniref:hypothetical protein n=1 Tax=Oligoflexus sp. TaxID=1971216 RepID=UPI002D6289CA|nr:hypothetical protein [Oligoflexus sp.]HYX39112.1 hypothetical protein [Oligoflexus sp.]